MLTCAAIFLLAMGVRLLYWQEKRFELGTTFDALTSGYRTDAQALTSGDLELFLRGPNPPSNANILGHPPGYAILMAAVFRIFGPSDDALRYFQIMCDSLACILLFFIALELFTMRAAVLAGLLAALAPQFVYHSLLLLPDSLAAQPILLSIYLIARCCSRPRVWTVVAAGALIGASCWLRANALLLAPFLVLIIPFIFERGRRLRYATALVAAALIVISPMTIRNLIVFQRFVPVSLGAGLNFVEGIADFDKERRFGLPATDMGVMKQEAAIYNRPDYYSTLYNPDGIERERSRTARSLAVVRSNPAWFLGVMLRRAASMLRLERVPPLSSAPAVSHSTFIKDEMQPVWASAPGELIKAVTPPSRQGVSLEASDEWLRVTGDSGRFENEVVLPALNIERETDYVLRVPVRVEQGSLVITVTSADTNQLLGETPIISAEPETAPEAQAVNITYLPFVSGGTDRVRVRLTSGASRPAQTVAEVGRIEIYRLGPSSYQWRRSLRLLVRSAQKLFITAWMLPLAIIGIVLLLRTKQRRAVLLLLVVPAYYLCIQSPLHTEYRYVLVIHFFLFALAAASLCWISGALWQTGRQIFISKKET